MQLTSKIQFFQYKAETKTLLGEIPSIDWKLPHDFFYPFTLGNLALRPGMFTECFVQLKLFLLILYIMWYFNSLEQNRQ